MLFRHVGMAALFCMTPTLAFADAVTPNKLNTLSYYADGNLFNAQGVYKAPGSAVAVGDHLVGILNVWQTAVGGTTAWKPTAQDQLTGIYALRVVSITVPPDPNDSKQTALSHVVFGTPSLTHFCRGTDCFDTGLIGTDTLALYRDTGASATPYSNLWELAINVAKATDGALWLTASYGAGADAQFGTRDDEGYGYLHTTGIFPFNTNREYHALRVATNHTGYGFSGVNDPNESELGGSTVLTAITASGPLDLHPNSTYVGGNTYWELRTNGQLIVQPTSGTTVTSVGGWVWDDKNKDGIQNEGLTPISGVAVALYTCNGGAVATSTTGGDGRYLFSGVGAGSYQVGFTLPSGYVFSPPYAIGDRTWDSDADPGTGKSACFTLYTGDALSFVDAGMYAGTPTALACGLSLRSSASPASLSCTCKGTKCNCGSGTQSCSGGAYVTYTHNVTNLGSAVSGTTLTDDRLGLLANIGALATNSSVSIKKKICVTTTVTDNVLASGTRADGITCNAGSSVTISVQKK